MASNNQDNQEIILYQAADGRTSVVLYARDGKIWLNQQKMAELFATSKQNISLHVNNILKDNELNADSVVKEYLTTAADGKTVSQGHGGVSNAQLEEIERTVKQSRHDDGQL